MKFTFLIGDVNWKTYGGKFVSKKLNNGDFDYYLVIDFCNMEDYNENKDGKYNVQIQAVSPGAAKEKLKDAMNSMCFEEKDCENNELMKVEALACYGTFATLWNKNGNNANELIQKAKKEATLIESLFGFYMDRKVNGFGNDGWDFIKDDIGFNFKKESENK